MSKAPGDKGVPFLRPGQVLDGRFVIDGVIGNGGQGIVYKLRHLEWNKDFALKLPLPKAVKSARSRELYLREAQAWIRLGVHPHIVRCWFVRPVDGLPALFLDLMHGGSLNSKIQSKAIVPGEWDKILMVLLQILEGLSHAHSMGMVHRDLKPENLMIDSDGRVCITDFGLVKSLTDKELAESANASLGSDSSITAGTMGTPKYGAPEQWLDPGSVSPATDIYSLGIIFFELMCGRRPFDSPDQPASPMTIIGRHLAEDPPHPRSLREDVPMPMADLCLRMIAKVQRERPANAEVMFEEVLSILGSRGYTSHQRTFPIPAGEKPDLLNNAAASLYSLGRTGTTRELLLKGLMIEAGHPQCVYNLTLLDRREGKLTKEEAIRRLKRARAYLGMALLHLEAGQGREAADILRSIPEEHKYGLLHRLEADALMYAGDFESALASYQKAARHMPNDLPTSFRMGLAEKRAVSADGRMYFPPNGSIFSGRISRAVVKLLLAPNAETLLVVDESELVSLNWRENRAAQRARRELYSTPATWCESTEKVLVLQDRTAFEIWSFQKFQLVSRMDGRVVARDSELQFLLVSIKEGLFLFDTYKGRATSITLGPGLNPHGPILAAFTHDQAGIGLITPDGQICTVGTAGKAMPLAWPPPLSGVEELRHFCLGRDMAVTSDRNSLLRCYCLRRKRMTAEVELGFIVSTLECDRSGSLIVASSPVAHAVLDKHGRFVTRGVGPLALDSSKNRCLVWADSRLQLYQLRPYQHLRSWEKTVHEPGTIQFSRDGRRALTIGMEGGHYLIWEVDEENRVFERSMLMTPGQTYQEIVTGFQRFQEQFQVARQCLDAKRIFESYQFLCKARRVPGFQQSEDALQLQWTLCGLLQREGLEAVWERLYISDTISSKLSTDGRHLLLAQRESIELFEISGPRIESRVKLNPGFQLDSAHFISDSSKGGMILAFGRDGDAAYYDAAQGELKLKSRFKTGRLVSVQLQHGIGLLHCRLGQVFCMDLATAKLSEPLPLMERSLIRPFLLDGQQALLTTHQGCLMSDLKRNSSRPGVPVAEESIHGEISFCADCENGKLRLTGFTDGALILSRPQAGRALYALKQEGGAVSAAAVSLEMALCVSVSDQGEITFFDLIDGAVLDHFPAHSEGVIDLSITQNGRYITTLSRSGQFRLWELSWKLSDRPGKPEIPWLQSSKLSALGKLFRR